MNSARAQLTPVPFPKIFSEPLERQKELCDTTRGADTREDFGAYILFPGDQTAQDFGLPMNREQIKRAEFSVPKRGPLLAPFVVGCVDYQFEFATGHHQTGFIFELWRVDPKSDPFHDLAIISGQSLPVSKLKLEAFAFGGDYAD